MNSITEHGRPSWANLTADQWSALTANDWSRRGGMVDEEFESWGAMPTSRSSVGMRAFLKRRNLRLNQRQGATPPVTICPSRPSQSSQGTSLAVRMPTLLRDVSMAPKMSPIRLVLEKDEHATPPNSCSKTSSVTNGVVESVEILISRIFTSIWHNVDVLVIDASPTMCSRSRDFNFGPGDFFLVA